MNDWIFHAYQQIAATGIFGAGIVGCVVMFTSAFLYTRRKEWLLCACAAGAYVTPLLMH